MGEYFPSRGMQALHVRSHTDRCADGSRDLEPGQNDARISPKFYLSEVTSNL